MQTACDFFERVLRRYPGSRMARYARERLERYGRLNSQNTETP
jgi:TolA-binding protein